ncbi:hypothetical protein DFO46_2859 [Rhizobium sp. AG855]|nr:hypothetical protein DFO46_2859 [Rhizobium sp. AG855]
MSKQQFQELFEHAREKEVDRLKKIGNSAASPIG